MFHRWLVAHDFDAASDAAGEAAATIASACAGADGPGLLVVCHVVRPTPLVVSPDVMGLPDVAAGIAASHEEAAADLIRACADLKKRHPALTVESRILNGPTVVSLLDAADAENVDAIAVGSHGRTGIAWALMGSISEAAVHKSRKPVLVVKLPEA